MKIDRYHIFENSNPNLSKEIFEDHFIDMLDNGWEMKFDSSEFEIKEKDYYFYKIQLATRPYNVSESRDVLLKVSEISKSLHENIIRCESNLDVVLVSLSGAQDNLRDLFPNNFFIIFVDRGIEGYNNTSDLTKDYGQRKVNDWMYHLIP